MNRYPVGNVAVCRFAFTLRPLTSDETAALLNSYQLPAGVGYTPDVVMFDYWPPVGSKVTLTGSQITLVEVGQYTVDLPVTAAGDWRWRGYGQATGGTPQVATRTQTFQAVDDRPSP